MVAENQSSLVSVGEVGDEDEVMAYQRLVRELDLELDDVWVDAIDHTKEKDELNDLSGPWVEDDNDALSEYVDNVSDFISPEDIDNLDW